MSNNLQGLNRDQLSQSLGGNYSVIRAFEQLVNDVGGFPSTIEEANALASAALSAAQSALDALATLAAAVAQLDSAPVNVPQMESDDTAPRSYVGTLGVENSDAIQSDLQLVDRKSLFVHSSQYGIGTPDLAGLQIFCGSGDTIRFGHRDVANVFAEDAVLNNNGELTTKQFRSNVATGTPPLDVLSTTRVANLNAATAGTADNLSSPTTFPGPATDAASTQTLVNALRAAAINKGL